MFKRRAVLLWLFAATVITYAHALHQAKEKADNANISGVWELTWTSNNRTGDLTFVQDKQALKVTLKPPNEEAITGTGTIKANAVEWSMTASGPQGDLKLAFKGKVEGETMSGEAQMGDTGTYAWTAKRKK